MNKYKVWRVFESGSCHKFYVVNVATKQVQSIWHDYFDAKKTQTKLNRS